MTTLLNQIVAVEKGTKGRAEQAFTQLHRQSERTPLLSGISRVYKPKDDEGDQLPPEKTLVQVNAEELLDQAATTLTDLFDITLTKEVANTKATADVTVDGKVLVKAAPVTYLLFLEKKLLDIRTFVSKLPVLDPAETWVKDANTGVWATEPSKTVKTKKVPKNWVKAEATDRHPAQVEIFHEDVIVGEWTTTKFSGALERTRLNTLLERVDTLIKAVKFAREEANNTEVVDQKTGDKVFGYLFS